MAEIEREKTLGVVRSEFQNHRFGTFVDEPLSVAQGGNGVIVPGCVTVRSGQPCAGFFMDYWSPLGLSRMARILYVSDCIFFPSRLTTHINFALSP